jgi:uncharacterized protein YjdB
MISNVGPSSLRAKVRQEVLTAFPVSISTPSSGAGVIAGGRVSVSVDAPGADSVVIVGPDDIEFSDKPPFTAVIQVPGNTLGSIDVIAIAFVGNAYAVSTPVSLIVKPTAEIQAILVEPLQIFLQVGRTTRLTARGYFTDGATRALTAESGVAYSSSNRSVVSVDTDGVLSAVSSGVADVTVAYGDQRATVPVSVTAADVGRRRAVPH